MCNCHYSETTQSKMQICTLSTNPEETFRIRRKETQETMAFIRPPVYPEERHCTERERPQPTICI